MLSLVIATLGRPHLLARVLDRLEAQDGGTERFEVVVAADAAERDLAAVRAAAAGRPFPVAVVQAETPGVSAARNRGVEESRYPVLLFLGDDMLPTPGLVGRHLAHHARRPGDGDAMIGHVRWSPELRPTPFMRWLDQGRQFDFHSIRGEDADWWHFIAANGSLKRRLFDRAGRFDESFRFGYEELELAVRLDREGLRLRYDASAVVEHLHPPTLAGWRDRMRRVAGAERHFVTKHPDMPPYFQPFFERAAAAPRMGRLARLGGYVPVRLPWIGPRARARSDLWFAQQLAPAFLEAWRDGQ